MADLHWVPIPNCPTHDRMHYRPPHQWACHGYDGEGCPHTVDADEQTTHATHLGTTDDDTPLPTSFTGLG